MQFKIKTMEISFNLQEPYLPQVLQDSQNFKFLRKNITMYRKIILSVARALWKLGIIIAKSYWSKKIRSCKVCKILFLQCKQKVIYFNKIVGWYIWHFTIQSLMAKELSMSEQNYVYNVIKKISNYKSKHTLKQISTYIIMV